MNIKNFFLAFIFFFLRDRGVGEGQKEREAKNPKQAPGSELSAQSLTNSWVWDHDLSWSQMLSWLSHPGAPGITVFLYPLVKKHSVVYIFYWCIAWIGNIATSFNVQGVPFWKQMRLCFLCIFPEIFLVYISKHACVCPHKCSLHQCGPKWKQNKDWK